jgi:formylglycine-generating enzyme required for sulfatase activity
MIDALPAFNQESLRRGILLATATVLIILSVDFFAKFYSGISQYITERKAEEVVAVDQTEDNEESDQGSFLASLLPAQAPQPGPGPGETRLSPVDGMVMVYVPGDRPPLAVESGQDLTASGRKSYKVYLDSFWISQTQVTNAMYAKCVAAHACSPALRKAINPHYYDSKYANHPTVYVTWYYARDYCKWVGGRLPSEAEWERAARDSTSRLYPWGDKNPGSIRANVNNLHNTTVPVGSYPAGASYYGVLDMSSNVREWVYNRYSPNKYADFTPNNYMGPKHGSERVLKGASWHDTGQAIYVIHRFSHDPGSAGDNRGFRCIVPPRIAGE